MSRDDLQADPLALVRPRRPRTFGVRISGDDVDAAELVEERAVLVRRLVYAARVRMDRADDREVRRDHVELEDRVAVAADGPRDQEQFRDDALLRSQDRAEFTWVDVPGGFEDHPQRLSCDRLDPVHGT